MANPIKNISVSMRYDGARVVYWSMVPGCNYPSDFILSVEYSRAGGPWTELATGLQTACAYLDARKTNFNLRVNDYYRVRIRSASTGENYMSDACEAGSYFVYPYNSEAYNVIRMAGRQIQLQGRMGVLLKKKEWGERCTHCVDFNGQESVNEHCTYCLGTGIIGGYYNGIVLPILESQEAVKESVTEIGYTQSSTVTARCIAYPWIQLGDVWVDSVNDERFYIMNANPVAKYKQAVLVYQLTMNKIELSDIMHGDQADTLVNTPNELQNAHVDYEPQTPIADAAPSWQESMNNL